MDISKNYVSHCLKAVFPSEGEGQDDDDEVTVCVKP